MTGFLTELAKKAADRWAEILVLPGLLWWGAVVVALRLGQGHALAESQMRTWVDQIAARPASHDFAVILLVAVAAVLGAAAAGLVVAGLGILFQRLLVLPGDLPPASWARSWRGRRWDAAAARLKTSIAAVADAEHHGLDPGKEPALARRRQRQLDRIGPSRPARPTPVGDRFLQVSARFESQYSVDPDAIWPRLWGVLPESFRSELQVAQASYSNANRLAGWGVAYLLLAVQWWPGAVIGAAVLSTAAFRIRTAAGALAGLVETAADLHLTTLARALGVPDTTARADTGAAVQEILFGTTAPAGPQT
jgi:hypothetical protein